MIAPETWRCLRCGGFDSWETCEAMRPDDRRHEPRGDRTADHHVTGTPPCVAGHDIENRRRMEAALHELDAGASVRWWWTTPGEWSHRKGDVWLTDHGWAFLRSTAPQWPSIETAVGDARMRIAAHMPSTPTRRGYFIVAVFMPMSADGAQETVTT